MSIPPPLLEPLSVTLAKLYRNQDLEPLILTVTGDGLYESWVSQGMPTRATIFALLQELDRVGLAERVLAEMLLRRTHSTELRALVAQAAPGALTPPQHDEVTLSAQRGGVPIPGLPNNAFAPGLQKNVRPHLQKLDLQVWLDKVARRRNCVCRIEIGTRAAGTGFLVGPAAVLTNWHVVEKAAEAGILAGLSCRFDYLRLSDGSRQSGEPIWLGDKGIAAFGRYSPAELTANPDVPQPQPDELDFALLHLQEAAGLQQVDGGPRGWVSLPDRPFPLDPDDPLLILQHPDGAPMKLALDTQSIIGPNGNGTRIRHRTNTDNGSSGSPCFNMDWDPVLLHHLGDPAWGAAKFNQGVPLSLIRARILTLGQAALLDE